MIFKCMDEKSMEKWLQKLTKNYEEMTSRDWQKMMKKWPPELVLVQDK